MLIGVDSFVAPCLLFVVRCVGLLVARWLVLCVVVCLQMSTFVDRCLSRVAFLRL